MAGLKAVLPAIDELPEALHEMYEERDGKFYLTLEGIEEHPSTSALRNALEAQKTARRKAAEENRALKDRLAKIPEDFNVEEYHTLKAKIEEYEADPAKRGTGDDKERQEAVAARKMLEQKIASIERSHKTEMEKLQGQIKKKSDFIHQLLIDEGLTKSLVDVGIDKNFLKAAKSLLRENVRVVEEDDNYRAVVESDTGDLDIPRFVQDWAASDEGKAFVPPAKGTDAGSGGNKRPPVNEVNPWKKETWNLTAQGKILRESRVKAEQMAKAANAVLPAPI
jgi:hypothetical protein